MRDPRTFDGYLQPDSKLPEDFSLDWGNQELTMKKYTLHRIELTTFILLTSLTLIKCKPDRTVLNEETVS